MIGKKLLLSIIVVLAFGIVVLVLGKWDWLIWGVILICPFMHFFGHNHSGHNHSQKDKSKHHH